MLIWKLAWRNIWRHKGKTLVIGVILCIGSMLMTVGNGIISGAKRGFRENIVERFSGDVTLIAGDEETQSVLFSESALPLKLLPDYPALKTVLEQQDVVDGFLPMSRGFAAVLDESGSAVLDEDAADTAPMLFGVDFEQYQTLFQKNVIAIEGRLLEHGERGIVLTEKHRDMIYNLYNFWVVPKGAALDETHLPPEALAAKDTLTIRDELVLLGLSDEVAGGDIRVPVIGIGRLQNFREIKLGSFIDIESFRQCFGYLSGNRANLSAEQKTLLAATDEGDLFEETTSIEFSDDAGITYDAAVMQEQTRQTNAAFQTEDGAYQFVVVKFKNGVSQQEGSERLRRAIADAGLNIKILSWQEAIGSLSQIATLMQGVLFGLVAFLFGVAALMITNTLSMAALERSAEIGMMRAVGMQKHLIGKMFLTEIGTLSLLFGGLGMFLGVLIIQGVSALHISTASHWMLGLLAGGDRLRPMISGAYMLLGVGQLAFVTIVAALYPMMIAQKITPLDAIARD